MKTQRQTQTAKPAAAEQVERDLEMALAILRRAGRKLTAALPEMNTGQQEQAQREIESARRELNRMSERIGKEKEAKHAEPGTANGHSGVTREGSDSVEGKEETGHARAGRHDQEYYVQAARSMTGQKGRDQQQPRPETHKA